MTIKEIEELAEMSRANIRFYESEGLLSPVRNANGYRDYSEEDLLVLKKIKLLRTLHISLEEIKALHIGAKELSVTLEHQIKQLSEEKKELDKAQVVCEGMYKDGVHYENLNAEKYLSNLQYGVISSAKAGNDKQYSWETYWETREAYEDTLPKVQAPWRRYFARMLDEAFYSTIWYCILALVLGVNLSNRGTGATLADIIMTLVLTFLLEPVQLALFGTTLGKWILGIHVLHNDDRKLTLAEAAGRTVQVLFYGLGFQIPIYSILRLWKSYNACIERETLQWEYDSRLVLKDERAYRVAVYIVVRAMFFCILLLVLVIAQIPLHRGELSVPQFCQNYRELAHYYGMENSYRLTNEGTWEDMVSENTIIIYPFGENKPPAFEFETDERGMIQKISFAVESYTAADTPKDDRPWMSSYQSQMQLAALAFVGARDSFPQFYDARSKMINSISSHVFEDYSFTQAGVNVVCDVEQEGYAMTGMELLAPSEEGECSFYFYFSMGVME